MLQVLNVARCWRDCPAGDGPSTTVCNPFNRWLGRGFWLKLLDASNDARVVTKNTAIDSTCIKAHCAAFGEKGAFGTAIGHSLGNWKAKV